MRFVVAAMLLAGASHVEAGTIRCDSLSNTELAVDGLLDDWGTTVLGRVGVASDGAIELRCSWDGTALAIALDIKDDRVVRVKGAGHEDHVRLAISAGRPVVATIWPGNAIAKPKHVKPGRIQLADSLQPKGFSIEAKVPASAIAGLSASTPSLELAITFTDVDRATGGDTSVIELRSTIELGDRKDLLDDFLRAVKLERRAIKLDTLAELDPDRRGKERIVAGGTVIGVLAEQYAFVSLPVTKPADVKRVELLALGPRGQLVVSALVRQTGNGGARELLMLWRVSSGQLAPLASIEVKKELGTNVLESTWRLAKGKKGPELVVEAKPAIGWSAGTWNEVAAADADSIVLPWEKAGIAYSITGKSIARRDLPLAKKR